MSTFNQEAALRLVLSAIKPVLDKHRSPEDDARTVDVMLTECLKMFKEEPQFAAAFEAACKAIWDTSRRYALNEVGE